MRKCGRSNSATQLMCDSKWPRFLSTAFDRGGLTLSVAFTVGYLAAALTYAPLVAIAETSPGASLTSGAEASGSSTGNPANSASPQSITEIPTAPGAGAAPAPQPTTEFDDGIIRYEREKNADISGPPIGSLDEFMSEGSLTSPLGIEVREDKRRLKSGGETQGLLIMDVFSGSPAARAGLHPYRRAMHDVLETAAVAGAMFVPPVVLLVPVLDQVRVGESYDLIIGVDGSRVANFIDFQDRLRDVQAGEIVYFSIIRNGERKQVTVSVPKVLSGPEF